MFKKSGKNSSRISSSACSSAPHVLKTYAPVLGGCASSNFSALFVLLFGHEYFIGGKVIMITGMLHSHVSSWAIGLILFFVSYFLLRAGKLKGQKITHMILRLFYILILVTGATIVIIVFAQSGFYGPYMLKAAIGLWVIAVMELILVKKKKGELKSHYWLQLALSLALVFFYGYLVLPY
jgi:hypothetical protein